MQQHDEITNSCDIFGDSLDNPLCIHDVDCFDNRGHDEGCSVLSDVMLSQEVEQEKSDSPAAETTVPDNLQIKQNKGSYAGGANTNLYGKQFEEKTSNLTRLLEKGFVKHSFPKSTGMFLQKENEEQICVFVMQSGLKTYMKHKHNIVLFRFPDEAYIIENKSTGKTVVKILEKKEQNVSGSVETKLWSGPSLKREYELVLGNAFEVHYAFCVSEFLQKKFCSSERKYAVLKTILKEHDIEVLFGDASDYFDTLDKWI